MNNVPTPIQRVRELLASAETSDAKLDIEAMRAGMESIPEANPPAHDILVQPTEIAGRPALEISAPGALPDRVVYHVHGGGLVAGSPSSHRGMLGELSRAAQATVIALDYRKAPENPYPAAYDDVIAGFDTLISKHGRIAVSGDSAGAGLALAILSRSAQAEGAKAISGVLMSPWADLSLTANSLRDLASRDPVVKLDAIRWMAHAYAGDNDLCDPAISPLHRDLTGLPPILIQVGSDEILLDDALAIDRKVRASGGDATLEVWSEMIHGWQLWTAFLPDAQRAIHRAGNFVREHFERFNHHTAMCYSR